MPGKLTALPLKCWTCNGKFKQFSLTIANNGQTENLVTVEKCRIRRQIAGLMVSRTSGSIAHVISISARFQMEIFSLVECDGVWATIS